MQDPGFQKAIQTAGGVRALARRTGIPEQTLQEWDRIPTAQVLVVEAATGVARSVLRPDLFNAEASAYFIDEIAYARAQGLRIVPTCSYARSYLARHPELAALAVS